MVARTPAQSIGGVVIGERVVVNDESKAGSNPWPETRG
jgi:hypothetical protein